MKSMLATVIKNETDNSTPYATGVTQMFQNGKKLAFNNYETFSIGLRQTTYLIEESARQEGMNEVVDRLSLNHKT